MDYEDAKKKVQAAKPQDGFLVVHIDTKLVLPHKEGVKLLEALGSAERLPRYYSDPKRITPLDSGELQFTTLSRKEYERYKIAALLNVDPDDLKEMEKQPPSP